MSEVMTVEEGLEFLAGIRNKMTDVILDRAMGYVSGDIKYSDEEYLVLAFLTYGQLFSAVIKSDDAVRFEKLIDELVGGILND